MQLVGRTCVHCRQRITREPDGQFCASCGRPVHHACAERALNAASSRCCFACGAPATPVQRAKTLEEERKYTRIVQGHRSTILGVGLMISGILGSMCCVGWVGDGALAVAGVALVGGAVLATAGYLRSTQG